MVVVNIVGFHYKVRLRDGSTVTVPFDKQPHEVPDEIAEHKFDNVFQIIVPPKPKEVIQTIPQIIEINITDDAKINDNTKTNDIAPPKEEEIKKPLQGKSIKPEIREKLTKKTPATPVQLASITKAREVRAAKKLLRDQLEIIPDIIETTETITENIIEINTDTIAETTEIKEDPNGNN